MWKNRQYVIQSECELGFWNNDEGWTSSLTDSTVFSHDERMAFLLPITADMDAQWVVIDYGDETV